MFGYKRNTTAKLPKPFWVLAGGSLINATGAGLVFPFMTLYLRQKLGIPMTVVGMLLMLNGAVGLAPLMVGGWLADRLGRRKLILFSLFSWGLATMGIGLADRLEAVAVALAIESLMGSLFDPAANAMVADIIPVEQRAEAYGILRVVRNLGIVIGPAIGGLVVGTGTYLYLFSGSALSALLFFLIALFGLPETLPTKVGLVGEEAPASYRVALRDRTFVAFCLVATLLSLVIVQLTTTLPVFLKDERFIPESRWGLLMSLNAAMVVLLQFPLTRLTERFSRTRMMALGALLYGLGYGAVALAPGVVAVAGCVVVFTLGEMIYMPTSTAFVADLAPAAMRGRYMGLASLVWGIGYSTGPFLGGLVMDRLGGMFIWPLCLLLGLVSGGAFLFLRQHAQRATRETSAAAPETP